MTRREPRWPTLWRSFTLLVVVTGLHATAVGAGTFNGAGETLGVDLVMHPLGYDGTGGTLELTVCVDPSAPNAAAASATLSFAVETWNARQAASPNISTSAGVGAGEIDFQSMVMRGLGLCLGLDDPSDSSGYTSATNGENDFFNRDDGLDDVPGTRDDLRGDDVNLMWFRFLDNDPFAVTAKVDSSTYTRNTVILPEGDTFAASPTRAVAMALGADSTESVMVATLLAGEAKRGLTADDLATLRYAESGLDETAGTADDYQVSLNFLGLAESCDLRLTFGLQAEPVACFGSRQQISGNHWRLMPFEWTFSTGVLWHFSGEGLLFTDGFESGDVSAWSSSIP